MNGERYADGEREGQEVVSLGGAEGLPEVVRGVGDEQQEGHQLGQEAVLLRPSQGDLVVVTQEGDEVEEAQDPQRRMPLTVRVRKKDNLSTVVRKAMATLQLNSVDIVTECVRKALDPADKDQAFMLRVLMDRLMPMKKSVEVSPNEHDVNVQIIVNGATTFETAKVRVVDN